MPGAEQLHRKAIALFEELAVRRPLFSLFYRDAALCYHSLGEILQRTQRREEATQAFRRAAEAFGQMVAIAPDDPLHRRRMAHGYHQLGSLLQRTGQTEQAQEAYRQEQDVYEALTEFFREDSEYQGKLIQSQFKLADLSEDAGRDQEARELRCQADRALEDALAANPDDIQLLAVRGSVFTRRGHWQQAADDYAKAFQHAPENPGLYLARGEAYVGLGRYDEAVADLNRCVELSPDNSNAALIGAQVLLLAGRIEDYRQACEDMLARFSQPDRPVHNYHAARACALASGAVQEPARAVELARQAVSRQPTVPWFRHCLGITHLRAGQREAAEQCFHESLKIDPTWEARFLNWLGLALVHHGRGETQQSRQWLEKAIEMMEQRPAHAPQDRLEARLLRREVEQLLPSPDNHQQDGAPTDNQGTTPAPVTPN